MCSVKVLAHARAPSIDLSLYSRVSATLSVLVELNEAEVLLSLLSFLGGASK